MNVGELFARLGFDVDLRGLNNFRNQMNNTANNTNSLINQMKTSFKGLGLAIASALSFNFAKNTAEEISQIMDLVSQVQTTARLTAQEMQGLRDLAFQLGKDTSFTTSEMLKALLSLARGGKNAIEMETILPLVAGLNEASGKVIGLDETANLLLNTLSSLGMEFTEVERVADILTQTSLNAQLDLRDMVESMKYAGAEAGMYKVSVEELATAIGTVAGSGSKGTMAGTGLKNIFARLMNPPKAVTERLKKLGIETVTADKNLRSFRDILLDTSKALKQLDPQKQALLIKDWAGDVATAEFAYLIANVDKYNNLLEKNQKAMGRTRETSKGMLSDLSRAFSELEGSIENVKTKIVEQLEPSIKNITKSISGLLDSVAQLNFKNVFKSVLLMGGMVVAFKALSGFVGLLARNLMTVYVASMFLSNSFLSAQNIAKLTAGFTVFQRLLLPIAPLLKIIASNFYLLLAPILLIGLAIEDFMTYLSGGQSITGELIKDYPKFYEVVQSIITDFYQIKDSISDLFTNLNELSIGLTGLSIGQVIFKGISASIKIVVASVLLLISVTMKLVSSFTQLFSFIDRSFYGLFEGFFNIGEVLTFWLNVLKDIGRTIDGITGGRLGSLLSAITGIKTGTNINTVLPSSNQKTIVNNITVNSSNNSPMGIGRAVKDNLTPIMLAQ